MLYCSDDHPMIGFRARCKMKLTIQYQCGRLIAAEKTKAPTCTYFAPLLTRKAFQRSEREQMKVKNFHVKVSAMN